jgi:Ca2+/Na+ antiporter
MSFEITEISKITLPVFAFYLIVFCNFVKETVGCRLSEVLETNMYAKHFVAILLLFFLVILADPNNDMERNILYYMGITILIYILYIITTRVSFPIMIAILLMLTVLYILDKIAQKKKEQGKEEQYKNYRLVQLILFIIIFATSIVGFILYFIEKYREYGKNFRILQFIIGNPICKKYTPKKARIIF